MVRFDHNFYRENHELNVQKTISKLGVDFINYKSNFDIVKKTMLESLIRRGDFCWHCHVGVSALPINIAIEKNSAPFYGEPSFEYLHIMTMRKLKRWIMRFNKVSNLGINAEDMHEMIKERFPNANIAIKDLKPYIFPSPRDLIQNKKLKAGF